MSANWTEKSMPALSHEEKAARIRELNNAFRTTLSGGSVRELAADSGHPSVVEMLKACVTDSVSPAICTAPDCSYTTEMEPDQDRGYCELCGGNTVASALVLADLI